MQVADPALPVDELAEQERATVAEPRAEAAELVPGVRLRHGVRPGRHHRPGQQAQPVDGPERVGVETELVGERLVQHEQLGVGRRLRLPRHRQLRNRTGEPVVQGDGQVGGGTHSTRLRAEVTRVRW